MNETEGRVVLRAYQPGVDDKSDAQIAEALRLVEANPVLATWWEEEQAFDRAIAAQLGSVPAPFGLKTRILAQAEEETPKRRNGWRWAFGGAVAVAALLLLAQVTDFWHKPQTANTPHQYAREMASFIQLEPPLEMESGNLDKIKSWLVQHNEKPIKIPARIAALDPVGCRVLSFRGHDVTLICFHADGKRLAHLFVVDRAALPKLEPGDKPIFSNQHGWMTATWAEGDRVYMIAMQGSRAMVEQFLPRA
ncbi:MAG: hypothetical protein ABI233_02920 [Chthoniobacterales bacterium]